MGTKRKITRDALGRGGQVYWSSRKPQYRGIKCIAYYIFPRGKRRLLLKDVFSDKNSYIFNSAEAAKAFGWKPQAPTSSKGFRRVVKNPHFRVSNRKRAR